jgi:hypothetical protein
MQADLKVCFSIGIGLVNKIAPQAPGCQYRGGRFENGSR